MPLIGSESTIQWIRWLRFYALDSMATRSSQGVSSINTKLRVCRGDLFVNFMLNGLLDGAVKHIQCTDWAMHFGLFVMWFDPVWMIQTAGPFGYICPVIQMCSLCIYTHAMHYSHYSQLQWCLSFRFVI